MNTDAKYQQLLSVTKAEYEMLSHKLTPDTMDNRNTNSQLKGQLLLTINSIDYHCTHVPHTHNINSSIDIYVYPCTQESIVAAYSWCSRTLNNSADKSDPDKGVRQINLYQLIISY